VRRLLLALALAASAGAAAGAPPGDPSLADIEGARSLALAATRGAPGGNDGMFANAAALAARRRYSIEGQFLQERLADGGRWQWLQVSVVDSETSAITGGVSYTRVTRGPATGSVYHLALAGPLGNGLYLGATGKYLDVRTSSGGGLKAATADAALFWQASQLVGFGVAGYNLFPIGDKAEAPRGLGVGLSVGDDRRFRLLADWRRDFDRAGKDADAWMVGAETLLAGQFPVRAGYLRDDARGGAFWSGGVGIVFTPAVALDLSFRQSVEAPSDRALAAGLRIFVPTGP
jgi:hypothetical protein